MGQLVVTSRRSLLPAGLLILYTGLNLSATAILVRGPRPYTAFHFLTDALFILLTLLIVLGLFRRRSWALYLGIAWTGLRLLWRLSVISFALYKERMGSMPLPEGPRPLPLLMLGLLGATLATFILLLSSERAPG